MALFTDKMDDSVEILSLFYFFFSLPSFRRSMESSVRFDNLDGAKTVKTSFRSSCW